MFPGLRRATMRGRSIPGVHELARPRALRASGSAHAAATAGFRLPVCRVEAARNGGAECAQTRHLYRS